MPRIQPKAPFELRLAQEALRVKEQIKSLPQGTASQINKWLSSIGLSHQR